MVWISKALILVLHNLKQLIPSVYSLYFNATGLESVLNAPTSHE